MNQSNTNIDCQSFFPVDLKNEKISTTLNTIYIQMKLLVQSLVCPNCGKNIMQHILEKYKTFLFFENKLFSLLYYMNFIAIIRIVLVSVLQKI